MSSNKISLLRTPALTPTPYHTHFCLFGPRYHYSPARTRVIFDGLGIGDPSSIPPSPSLLINILLNFLMANVNALKPFRV